MPNKCIVCGKAARNRYCSKACESLHKQHMKICVVCGKEFADSPSNATVCCSESCSSKHRTRLHESGVYDNATAQMLDAKQKFLSNHSGELHVNAKHWIIRSQAGTIYECQNLMNFIRQHPDLFDGTPKQAFDGFAKIKATEQGKRPKARSHSWKGWTLVSWSD